MPIAAVRYAAPGSIPAGLPRYAALCFPTGSTVPSGVVKLEGGYYLPTEATPADRRRVGVVQYLPGDAIPADMRRIILARGGSVAYANAVLADSPAGWWRLNQAAGTTGADTVLDSSGNARHGTPAGGVTFGVLGPLAAEPNGTSDTAASFDGTDDYVDVAAFGSALANWTIAFWAKTPVAQDSTHDRIVSTTGNRIEVGQASDGTIRVYDGAWLDVSSLSTTEGYAHFAFTYDGTTLKVYKNAAEVHSGARGRSIQSTDAWRFGSRINGGVGELWAGTVDEVAVYPAALSPARIAAHYAAGTGR